jgi:hypothetical protein
MEHWWSDTDKAKPNFSKKNLFQCNTVRHKSHVAKPDTESGPRRSNPRDTVILLKIQIFWDSNRFDVSKYLNDIFSVNQCKPWPN